MARTVKVTITADVAGGVANIKTFKGALTEMGSEIDRAAVKHPDQLNKIASATGRLGIGAAIAFGAVVKTAADFDRQMSAVVAVTDDGTASLDALRQAALNAGRDTAFTATQAATAEEELAKAGVSTKDILGGGLAGALNLAAAGSLDLGTAATISAQAMNEFGLDGKQVGRIADDLASAANASAADVEGLGLALGQVGGVAHQVGLSLEDTVGVLADFTQQGMNGEEAGTTLKQMLLKLTAPTQQATDIMRQLGIKIYDTTGKFVGITGVAQQLHDTLGGLTEAQRNAALGTLFGARAVRGATVLYQQGAAGLQDWIDKSSVVGQAADTAATKLDNLTGDLHKLLGSLQAVTIEGSGGVTTFLRGSAQAAESAVNAFGSMPKPVAEGATALLGVSAAGLLATSGLLRAKVAVSGAMQALRDMGPLGSRAATSLGLVGSAVGKITIALVALQTVSAMFGTQIAPKIAEAVSGLNQFATSGVRAGVALSHLDYDLSTLSSGGMAKFGNGVANTIEGMTGLGSVFDESMQHARERLGAIDSALASMVSSGHADQATAAFQALTDVAQKQGISIDDLKKGLPQYAAVLDGATTTQQASAAVTADQTQKFDLLHASLSDAIDAVGSLKDAFDALNGKATDVAGATINMTDAVDALDKSMKENGKSFDDLNVKGAANLDMFLKGAAAARDHAQAVFDLTGSVDQASAAFNTDLGKLDAVAAAHGATKAQVDALNRAYAQLPPLVSTQVSTPGLDDAKYKAGSFRDLLNSIDGRRYQAYLDVQVRNFSASATFGGGAAGQANSLRRWGGVTVHAAAGSLRDASVYGPANPARYAFAEPATRGEAFIPKSGNLTRSRAIADYVVGNWLGGSTSWGPGQGGRAAPVVVAADITVRDDTGRLFTVIRSEVNGKFGGSVQSAFGRPGVS